MEPERGSEPIQDGAVGREADVVRVGGLVAGAPGSARLPSKGDF